MAAAIEAPEVIAEAPSLLSQFQNAQNVAQTANGILNEGNQIFHTGEEIGGKVFNTARAIEKGGAKLFGGIFKRHHHH